MIVSFARRFNVICQFELWLSEMGEICYSFHMLIFALIFSLKLFLLWRTVSVTEYRCGSARFTLFMRWSFARKCRKMGEVKKEAISPHHTWKVKLSEVHKAPNMQKWVANKRKPTNGCRQRERKGTICGSGNGDGIEWLLRYFDDVRIFKSRMDSTAQSQQGEKWIACINTRTNKRIWRERVLGHVYEFYANFMLIKRRGEIKLCGRVFSELCPTNGTRWKERVYFVFRNSVNSAK